MANLQKHTIMKVDLKNFKVKKSFKGDECTVCDLREQFADLIYTNTCGMRAFKLAEKIYSSDGEVDLDDIEAEIFKDLVNEKCTPQIIDSLRDAIA